MSVSEDDLIRRLMARDARAMTVFYQHYRPALHSAVLRIVRNQHTAEDVVQESMVKVWRSIASYDPEQSRLFTWAAKICCNTAIDYVRTGRHRMATRTQSLEDSVAAQRQTVSFRPEDIGVADLLLGLRSEYRWVMELMYLQGYTQQ